MAAQWSGFQVGTLAGVLNAGSAVAKPAAKGMSPLRSSFSLPADASGNENKVDCPWRAFDCDPQLGGMFLRRTGFRRFRLSHLRARLCRVLRGHIFRETAPLN